MHPSTRLPVRENHQWYQVGLRHRPLLTQVAGVILSLAIGACQSADVGAPVRIQPPPAARHSLSISKQPPNGLGFNVNTLRDPEGTETAAYLPQVHATVVRFSVYGWDAVGTEGVWTGSEIDQTVQRIIAQNAVPLAVIAESPRWVCNGGNCPANGVPEDSAWASLVRTIVGHMAAMGVEYFEVGNEYNDPNHPSFSGSPSDYDRLAGIAIREIHAVGKAAVGPAAGGGDPGWSCPRIAANDFDVISTHVYGTWQDIVNTAMSVRNCPGAAGKPFWITEAGSGAGVDEATSNSILAGLLAHQTWDQTIWWHLFMPTAGDANLLRVDGGFHVVSLSSLFYTARDRALIGMNEYWSPNTHLFTTQQSEYRGSDRSLGTTGKFYGYPTNTGGLTPLVRCVFHGAKKVRMLAKNSCPSDWLQENVPSLWVWTTVCNGCTPLYALRGAYGNMFYTTDPSERAAATSAGWTDMGFFAWVLPPASPPASANYAVPAQPGRVAVHVGWSQLSHIYYEGSFGSAPSGFSPDHDTHFVLATAPEPGTNTLVQCTLNGRYRVAYGSCPAGWSVVSTLGYAMPPGASTSTADFVLKEYASCCGAYFATADPKEQADVVAGGWTLVGSIARVWF